MSDKQYDYIVIGGGIAGVVCCETIAQQDCERTVLMISASPLIKQMANVIRITKTLEYFDVGERPLTSLAEKYDSITVVHRVVSSLDAHTMVLTGPGKYVIGLRDTDSASLLADRLKHAKRVAIVGNGGIAMELVYEIRNCSLVWVIRDAFVNHVFFDEASARFIMTSVRSRENSAGGDQPKQKKTLKYKTDEQDNTSGKQAGALGPDWITGVELVGAAQGTHKLEIEFNTEVDHLLDASEIADELSAHQITDHTWPCYLKLTNGKVIGCDFVISATGVHANYEEFVGLPSKIRLIQDAIEVDDQMRTGERDVYAAGDVCHASWVSGETVDIDWFQARQMGYHAAMCMLAHTNDPSTRVTPPFAFELFEHCTYFCGFKVILLGRYNCQGLSKYELMYRYTEGDEFIKLVIVNGRIRGAVIIGDLELAETIENLMLSAIDVSPYGEDLLDTNLVDIADYFD